jgi:hypothetical protein
MTNSHNYQKELAVDRFSLKVTARLSDGVNALPRDTTERLRAARVRAIASRKPMQVNNSTFVAGSGVAGAVLSGSHRSAWWRRLAATLPLLALLMGLAIIDAIQGDERAKDLAEIDAAILTDDLPPTAYADPGFAHFLKLNISRAP